MARKSFSVLFFIKKGKLLKNEEAPVCIRITVNDCIVDIYIKRSCPVNLWNQAKENSKGKDRMSVELNHYLEITRSRIHQIYRELETSDKVINEMCIRDRSKVILIDITILKHLLFLEETGICQNILILQFFLCSENKPSSVQCLIPVSYTHLHSTITATSSGEIELPIFFIVD